MYVRIHMCNYIIYNYVYIIYNYTYIHIYIPCIYIHRIVEVFVISVLILNSLLK